MHVPDAGSVRSSGIRALFEYREVLTAMVRRDLLVRYQQSVMGVGWALLVPLSSMLVFTVVFTRIVPLETDLPYPVFAYSGLLAWTWLASSIQFATTSLTGNMALVTKVYFPRALLPLSAVLVSFVDFFVATGLLLLLILWYGVPLHATIVFVPVLIVIQMTLAYGVALFAALGNLFFRDVRYLVGVLVPLWMFVTPVVYPLDAADPALQRVLRLNPATPLIEAYRTVLFDGRLPDPEPLLVTALGAVLLLTASWSLFHRLEPRFAELI